MELEGGCLVIGDGYGTVATLLMAAAPDQRIFLVNLTKALFLDLLHMERAFPEKTFALVSDADEMTRALEDDSIRIVAVRADDAELLREAPIGLAVNIVSMQEMEPDIVHRYFEILRRNPAPRTAFYCCNRRAKVSNFYDYPWEPADTVLADGVCEWAQWYYTPKPPFWYRRAEGPKEILHRLAWLDKTENANA